MIASLTLAGFLESRYLVENFGLSPGYIAELRRTVRQLDEHAGYSVSLSELSGPLVAGFLSAYLAAGWSAVATNNKRRELLTLWRAAADVGMAPAPSKIKRLPEPREVPTAWTAAEVARLVEHARGSSGSVAMLPAGHFWSSLIVVAYWSGVRIGALRRVRLVDCDLTRGMITVRGRTQKAHKAQTFVLPQEAVIALAAIMDPPRELLWPWPHCRRHFFRTFRRIVESAGLECPRTSLQLFHRLRRTHISYCWLASPELAQRQAGHSSVELTRSRYVSPMIVPPVSPVGRIPSLIQQ